MDVTSGETLLSPTQEMLRMPCNPTRRGQCPDARPWQFLSMEDPSSGSGKGLLLGHMEQPSSGPTLFLELQVY